MTFNVWHLNLLMKKKPHILVSNDDGIDATGLYTLVKALRKFAHVSVVAPSIQQSAVGHAITVRTPLRAHEFRRDGKLFGYAVDGTPADSVKLAIRTLLKSKPVFVISGINNGAQHCCECHLLRNSQRRD